jgi:hypothetical protein
VLKVIGSRPDTLIENFRTLLPTGTGADFRRILDLKVCWGSTARVLATHHIAERAKASPCPKIRSGPASLPEAGVAVINSSARHSSRQSGNCR